MMYTYYGLMVSEYKKEEYIMKNEKCTCPIMYKPYQITTCT